MKTLMRRNGLASFETCFWGTGVLWLADFTMPLAAPLRLVKALKWT